MEEFNEQNHTACRNERKETLMTGSKKYNVIYADPPWRYEQRTVKGGAEQHYPTMTLDDICALPVAELAIRKYLFLRGKKILQQNNNEQTRCMVFGLCGAFFVVNC